jgi:hypothetical protein
MASLRVLILRHTRLAVADYKTRHQAERAKTAKLSKTTLASPPWRRYALSLRDDLGANNVRVIVALDYHRTCGVPVGGQPQRAPLIRH